MTEAVVATIAEGYKDVHRQLREAIQSLDTAALSWAPGAETNSAQVLVVHLLGSEGEIWRTVANLPSDRDRPTEFRTEGATVADLLSRLDAADALVDEVAPHITTHDLHAMKPRGDRPPQTGLSWLITNYGHAREHLAQLQLTLQLWQQRR